MITWNEVLETHRSWRGVATRGGKVVSLLCNQHKDGEYGDAIFADRIEYMMPNDSMVGDRRALHRMVGGNESIHVFEKLGVNAWKDHGEWVVTQMFPRESVTIFELKRAPPR